MVAESTSQRRPVARPVAPSAQPVVEEFVPKVSVAQQMRVKICGLTNLEDAQYAVDAGAWAIGMIFWPGSPRRCSIENAQLIGHTFKRQLEVVGVFVDQSIEQISQAVELCELTTVQLHGEEGPAYCDEVARRTGAKVIRAARVQTAGDVDTLKRYSTYYHLLDTYKRGVPGGTGETFNWDLTKIPRSTEGKQAPRLILSGGITGANVAEAIGQVKPFAIDVASGVESAPGKKDHAKITDLITRAVAAREAMKVKREAPSE